VGRPIRNSLRSARRSSAVASQPQSCCLQRLPFTDGRKGNAPGGFPALAGQHAQYVADQLRAYRKGYEDPAGRTNDGDTMIMRTIAFGLSDKEIEAVSSYVAGLK
jgi:hypothetical protein